MERDSIAQLPPFMRRANTTFLNLRAALVAGCRRFVIGTTGWDAQRTMVEGLLVEHARARGAVALVRGLRQVSDFDFEFRMALANRRLAPEVVARAFFISLIAFLALNWILPAFSVGTLMPGKAGAGDRSSRASEPR